MNDTWLSRILIVLWAGVFVFALWGLGRAAGLW